MTTLVQLAVGGQGCVARVTGDDQIAARLMEMGVTPGVAVRVVAVAPLGDPIELELRGYRLSVRRAEAGRVELAAQS